MHLRTSSSITLPGLMQSLSGFSSCISSNSALARFRHCLFTALPSGDVSPLYDSHVAAFAALCICTAIGSVAGSTAHAGELTVGHSNSPNLINCLI
ncbi:Hydrogenase maturation factor HypE [Pseudomonas syringae pv. actinidiae]|uniref:Hydrogenase maturation factor HypE n=1 Tax=Pseudomonas syringae pv. actinidiae TaxID=103796 RepID=A0AAN4Q685_PSESF|nr:Hydrogenase maturation factor HypE [Pseudomonas syringae pv. actinidiae]